MKQQGFIVAHQELTELNIERFNERRDAKKILSNLGNLRHKTSSRIEPSDHTHRQTAVQYG
jgi:hypothetical protein